MTLDPSHLVLLVAAGPACAFSACSKDSDTEPAPPLADAGADNSQQKTHLELVISTRAGAGDTKLKLLGFATQDQADGLGCDWHPNTVTHQKTAVVLTAALKADLGW